MRKGPQYQTYIRTRVRFRLEYFLIFLVLLTPAVQAADRSELAVSCSASPSQLTSGEQGQVTVLVTLNGNPVHNVQVSLSSSFVQVSPATGITDSSGIFRSRVYAPSGVAGTDRLIAQATYSSGSMAANVGTMTGSGTVEIPVQLSGSISPSVTPTDTPAQGNKPPIVIATANPLSGNAPMTVAFDASGSYDPDGTITSYSWNFADGQIATGKSVTHTFANPGSYRAMVTVTDSRGLVSSPVYLEIRVLQVTQNTPVIVSAHNTMATGRQNEVISVKVNTIVHPALPPLENGDSGSIQMGNAGSFSLLDGIQRFLSLLFKDIFISVSPPLSPEIPRNLPETAGRNLSRGEFFTYLQDHPRIRAQMRFETAPDTFLYYDTWPQEWKDRLFTFYQAFLQGQELPLGQPLPLAPENTVPNERVYLSVELARDTYLAQVSHALWLDSSGKVPWRLEEWSDDELSYLLSSRVLFSVRREFSSQNLSYYTVGNGESSDNIFGDPRTPYAFMEHEPEQGASLIGATPAETGALLSGWFHDYLWHSTADFRSSGEYITFYRDHPLLEDRLKRYSIPGLGNVYVVIGCTDASSLFTDLMRSVNIPVKKVTNILEDPSGVKNEHAGLAFDWQGHGNTSRYLLHTDDLYMLSVFEDPVPVPKETPRGFALWNQAWLDATAYGSLFSYSNQPGIFSEATFLQQQVYHEQGQWLLPSAQALYIARSFNGQQTCTDYLVRERNVEGGTAKKYCISVEKSILAYGDGDMATGYQRLLDGPDSRHAQWCARTGKCG